MSGLRYTALYPVLFAATRVLYVAAYNPGQFAVGDLLIVLASTLALTIALYAAAWLLFRGRLQGMLPALATFMVLAWIFGAPPIEESLTGAGLQVPGFLLGLAAAVATVVLAYGLVRHPRTLRFGEKLLTATYTLLLVYLGVAIVRNVVNAREHVAGSLLASDLAKPVAAQPPLAANRSRNIYVLVLDEYDNAEILREVLDFDNTRFEDSLRALGFHVPRSVHSNYAHTYLSLPSFLNAAHVSRVEGELPRGSDDPTLLNSLVDRSRVARFLQEQGYRFVFFPSAWWNSTRASRAADSVVEVMPWFSLGREVSRTEFRRVFRRNTLAWRVYTEAGGDYAIVRGTLDGVGRIPVVPGPVFAFAHLMSPHPPHVFGPSCGERPTEWDRDPASYLTDLECLNRLLLATVTRLIQTSEVPPVIILQGDHGTTFRRFADAPDLSRVDRAAVRERMGAFGAYYLPDGGAAALGDTVTVVNVLGHVMRFYFGAELPREPDDLFVSLNRAPFEFRKVDIGWLGRAEPSPSVAATGHRP
ncbi:MAG TPA: hypothetical protein VIQ27_04540 [Gemmatimonadales bacterium]|jgi:Predicted membrane-associated, metal-dependent hydrolase